MTIKIVRITNIDSKPPVYICEDEPMVGAGHTPKQAYQDYDRNLRLARRLEGLISRMCYGEHLTIYLHRKMFDTPESIIIRRSVMGWICSKLHFTHKSPDTLINDVMPHVVGRIILTSRSWFTSEIPF